MKSITTLLVAIVLVVIGVIGLTYVSDRYKPEAVIISQDTSGATAEFNGVSFQYGSLAEAVTGENILAHPFTEPQPGGSGNAPYIRFSFDNEKNEDFFVPSGRYLLVYPTAEYQDFLDKNSFGADWSPTALANILTTLPLQPNNIPIAPVPTASQVIRSQVQYMTFNGGKGVRFLTSYAQDVSPITNQNLIYTFQGLSDDGNYWISFFYPVTAPFLPDTASETMTAQNYTQFAQNFNTHLAETVTELDHTDNNSFSPSLNKLDSLVTSLTLGQEIKLP